MRLSKASVVLSRMGSGLLVLTLLIFVCASAIAQTSYPNRAVRILVGFGPGTSPDIALRVFADKLSQSLGKAVVVENVVGAAGNIAGERVARAYPDGHTLLFAGSASIVMSPSLYKRMSYDPVTELKPVSILYSHPNVLVANKDLPANNVQELVALARARPGALNVASSGSGTTQHLNAEMLRRMAQIELVHVPYLGGSNLMPDLLAGRVHFFFGIPTVVLDQVREGGIKALAVTSSNRISSAPELPTMIESGFPDFEMNVWWGLLAPSGTPPALIETLHRATAQVVALPDVRKRFEEMNVEPVGNTPAEFSAVIAAELPKWAKVIAEAGVRLD